MSVTVRIHPGASYQHHVHTGVSFQLPSSIYAPRSVKEAWDNYFEAFGRQDLNRLMANYDDTSHIRVFNNVDGAKSEFKGTDRIRQHYKSLFSELSDHSTLDAPVTDIDEEAGQVFLCWKCPGSGFLAATDTFIFSRNYKIWKQNTVLTKVPSVALALMQQPAIPVVKSLSSSGAYLPTTISNQSMSHSYTGQTFVNGTAEHTVYSSAPVAGQLQAAHSVPSASMYLHTVP
eukprot:gnl/TRDRNA2_/TRDRNA2_43712_c0_seq2.p1 gnl/TRDRNA2_/TRDRNA2_43712_c0~~gnl/TRDRNA2_/TRDRNA2_43712_c0_seq2.p1  ORF type:complete len:231 (-),score=27.08 gnl/TRDRNA2_/TRDRNA2_43712_c0_seq2:85-777(-)